MDRTNAGAKGANINSTEKSSMIENNKHGTIQTERPMFETLTTVPERIMITSLFREQDGYKMLMEEDGYGFKLPI